MIIGGTILDQTDGCANHSGCSIAYYLMYFLLKSYQIALYKVIYIPGHGKYVVDDMNTVQKRYLATCFKNAEHARSRKD